MEAGAHSNRPAEQLCYAFGDDRYGWGPNDRPCPIRCLSRPQRCAQCQARSVVYRCASHLPRFSRHDGRRIYFERHPTACIHDCRPVIPERPMPPCGRMRWPGWYWEIEGHQRSALNEFFVRFRSRQTLPTGVFHGNCSQKHSSWWRDASYCVGFGHCQTVVVTTKEQC